MGIDPHPEISLVCPRETGCNPEIDMGCCGNGVLVGDTHYPVEYAFLHHPTGSAQRVIVPNAAAGFKHRLLSLYFAQAGSQNSFAVFDDLNLPEGTVRFAYGEMPEQGVESQVVVWPFEANGWGETREGKAIVVSLGQNDFVRVAYCTIPAGTSV